MIYHLPFTIYHLPGLVRDGARAEGARCARDQAQDPRGHPEELRAHGGREDEAPHRHAAPESRRKGGRDGPEARRDRG